MFVLAASLFAATLAVASSSYRDCVLAGPDYPAPAKLSGSGHLSEAVESFERLLSDPKLGLKPNDTAWGVALFSSKEQKTLYQHYYTPLIDVGVKKVDENSIFRIGSVSKVFSVYSFLIEAGDRYFNDPITQWVPELADEADRTIRPQHSVYDDIDAVRWHDVTLGQLASHAAGIARDPTANDLQTAMATDLAEQVFGLPALNKSEQLTCDTTNSNPCSRKAILSYLFKQHPLFAPQHSPAYTNIAFTLLGYAQEAITGTSFSQSVESSIIAKLGMQSSSYEKTPDHGVIPGNDADAVGWNINLGQSAPSGSFYSSTADMVKACQAILQSRLLSHAETRRWLRPLIQTGYLGTAVGAPWEIRYLTAANQHLTEVYTKQGDLGDYHAGIALSTDHDLGWVVLTAGTPTSNSSNIRTELFDSFSNIFVPMAEKQSEAEAVANFNGTYVDPSSNSSVTITVGDSGRPGLGVPSMMARGVQVIGPLSPMIQEYGVGASGRLYPSQLRTMKKTRVGGREYTSRLGFRASFFNETEAAQLEDPCLRAWTAVGAPSYGQATLDDWVFELNEEGQAEVLDVRMWRLKLRKQ